MINYKKGELTYEKDNFYTMAFALVATYSTAAFAAVADDADIKKDIGVKQRMLRISRLQKLSVPTLCGAKWSSHTA